MNLKFAIVVEQRSLEKKKDKFKGCTCNIELFDMILAESIVIFLNILSLPSCYIFLFLFSLLKAGKLSLTYIEVLSVILS